MPLNFNKLTADNQQAVTNTLQQQQNLRQFHHLNHSSHNAEDGSIINAVGQGVPSPPLEFTAAIGGASRGSTRERISSRGAGGAGSTSTRRKTVNHQRYKPFESDE